MREGEDMSMEFPSMIVGDLSSVGKALASFGDCFWWDEVICDEAGTG